METSRTGGGDVDRTLRLLWRHEHPLPARRGPRPRLTVDDVVAAAIALADAQGLQAVTMRALAAQVGLSPMALYGYVPGRDELVDLMVDDRHLAMERSTWPPRLGWRKRVTRVADEHRALLARHPWLAEVSTARPPLGPGTLAKYEHELAAFDHTGLDDVQVDAALTFVLAFVQSHAVAARAARSHAGSDAEWWEHAGPLLAKLVDPDRYPRATRVGTAAGEAQGAAYDPERAYAFGLQRVLDGLAPLMA